MSNQSGRSYGHRRNNDGSYDSICTKCFATVASTRSEAELTSHERTHTCIPDWPYQAGPLLDSWRLIPPRRAQAFKEG